MNIQPTIKEAWKKFRIGDPISNEELQMLLSFTKDLEKSLIIIGETGGILFKLRMDISTLESFIFYRNNFNKEKNNEA